MTTNDRLMTEATHDPVSETTLRQRRAATPGLSAWVAANAGSGKTHVLANRVIRLLLAGARPSAILCLTYTKAAAAEMSNRVFRILADWTRLPQVELGAAIAALEDRQPTDSDISRARQLFALALETPGGLKIQTIHAFCEAVLHRFPLEANIAGRFQVLADSEAANLLAEARRLLFSTGSTEESAGIVEAIEVVLDLSGESGLDALLSEIYAKRRDIAAFLARADGEGGVEPALRAALGLHPGESVDDVCRMFWPLHALPVAYLRELSASAATPSTKKFADVLLLAGSSDDIAERRKIVSEAFLTGKNEPRKLSNVTAKTTVTLFPDIEDRLALAMSQILEALDRQNAFAVLEANRAALAIAQRYISEFERLKRRQAFLDFDDLVAATDSLLSRSGAGAWVHYKLDQGIDHILVDEAQDTAPLQWSVIRALAAEFFAGEGARGGVRTLFTVGDEKQSIYSFQGAQPESFSSERAATKKRALKAGLAFDEISLRVSFRSTGEVLKLVDLVYSANDAQRGMGQDKAAIIHESARAKAPGSVEIWEKIQAEKGEESESWTDPFDANPESAPAARLASRIADRIGEMVGRETLIDAKTRKSRKIRPGDILVLVRKRDGFVPTLLRMLKARGGIPVAGADRLKLTDHIAIQDLMALGRHVLLSADDLSLAALVKSPLVDLDEDALFRLAANRPHDSSVFQHLESLAASDPDFERFLILSNHWRQLARDHSVHDFFASILGPGEGRARYLARLGTEVSDVLDEFLNIALEHDEAGIPGLQSFIAMLETETPEIKREMEKEGDAVRVMTVHASKGLEAPVVFLIDSGGAAWQTRHMPKFWWIDTSTGNAPLWLPNKQFQSLKLVTQAIEDKKEQAEEEYRRLLYVGLTRAADHLVVCGYCGVRPPKTPTWYSLVEDGFEAATGEPATKLTVVSGERDLGNEKFAVRTLRLVRNHDSASAEDENATEAISPQPQTGFVCPDRPLPKPTRLPRPLVPSASGASLSRDKEDNGFISPFAERARGDGKAAERGKAAHRLLQVLPGLAKPDRHEAAKRYVERALPTATAENQNALVSECLTILEDSRFTMLFDGESGTEISVMGTIDVGGIERVVSGRIDRMTVTKDAVLILDYKTGAMAPDGGHHSEHMAQLAIYRALLAPLYPNHEIKAGLLYTSVPKLVVLASDEMDAALAKLMRSDLN